MNTQKKYGNADESARLRSVISRLGLSNRAFADKIGISAQQIGQVIKQERALSENIAYAIERAFSEVNPKWLLSGEGEMLKTGAVELSEPKIAYGQTTTVEDLIEKGNQLAAEISQLKATVAKIVEEGRKKDALTQELTEALLKQLKDRK